MTTAVLPLREFADTTHAGGPAGPDAAPLPEVVRRAQAGDGGAFRALYDAHVGRVHALCLRLTGDRGEAEELTQDVFVRVWERLGTFRGDSAFSTWLHRLAVNAVLMARRTAARRHRRVQADATLPEAPGRSRDVGTIMDLERAIASLPDGCRTVFVLHDIEGWRHEEIAAELGIAAGTCRAHLFRARRLLREALGT